MSEEHGGEREPAEPDPAADTSMFQAFQDRDPRAERVPPREAAPFRILTLLLGLAALAVVIWLLLL